METSQLNADAMAYSNDGALNYLAHGSRLFSMNANAASKAILKYVNGADLVTTDKGYTYITCPAINNKDNGKILLLRPGSRPMMVDSGLRYASAITISPDKNLLL